MKNTLLVMLIGCLLWAMPSRSLSFREALWPTPSAQVIAPLQAAASTVSASASGSRSSALSLRQVILTGVVTVFFIALRRLG